MTPPSLIRKIFPFTLIPRAFSLHLISSHHINTSLLQHQFHPSLCHLVRPFLCLPISNSVPRNCLLLEFLCATYFVMAQVSIHIEVRYNDAQSK